MNQHLGRLMQKEVSRKEFLGMSGLALLSIFGLGTIAKLLSGHDPLGGTQHHGSGYGASSYGN